MRIARRHQLAYFVNNVGNVSVAVANRCMILGVHLMIIALYPCPKPKAIQQHLFRNTRPSQLELFCESCEEVICLHCIIRQHKDHQYDLVAGVFTRHKEIIVASIVSLRKHQEVIGQALLAFDVREQDISQQDRTVEHNIKESICQLIEVLQQRESALLSDLHQITEHKLKALSVQRERVEMILMQVDTCLAFAEESLADGNEGEILATKKAFLKQAEVIINDIGQETLNPIERADTCFKENPDIKSLCSSTGLVHHSDLDSCSKVQTQQVDLKSQTEDDRQLFPCSDNVSQCSQAPVLDQQLPPVNRNDNFSEQGSHKKKKKEERKQMRKNLNSDHTLLHAFSLKCD